MKNSTQKIIIELYAKPFSDNSNPYNEVHELTLINDYRYISNVIQNVISTTHRQVTHSQHPLVKCIVKSSDKDLLNYLRDNENNVHIIRMQYQNIESEEKNSDHIDKIQSIQDLEKYIKKFYEDISEYDIPQDDPPIQQ